MLADSLRRRLGHHPGWLRTAALLTAALAVLGLAVAAPHAARADADPGPLSVHPMGVIRHTGSETVAADVVTEAVGGTATVTADNNSQQYTEKMSANHLSEFLFDVDAFRCNSSDNTIHLDLDYDGTSPPSVSQTIRGITVICPTITVSPPQIAGLEPITITLPQWDGFDTLGKDQGVKSLYVHSTAGNQLVGTFGYKVAPEATFTPAACGDNQVELRQPSPYGDVVATTTINVFCPDLWSVAPHAVIDPQGDIAFTVSSDKKWAPIGPIRVYTDEATTPVGTITTPKVDPNGDQHWSGTFNDGGYFGPGAHNIRVEVDYNQINFANVAPGLNTRVYKVPFYVLDPKVYAYQNELNQSALPYTQTIYLDGFDNIDDAYTNRNPQPKTLFLNDEKIGTSTTDEWKGALSPPCGQSTLKVTQPTPFGEISAEQPLTVFCPHIELSPAVIARDSQPRTLLLNGTSFHPSDISDGDDIPQPYVITLDGKQVAADDMDEAGAFASTFPASGLACGPHDVTITEQERPGENNFVGLTKVAPQPTPAAAATAAADPPDPDAPLTVSTVLVVNCPSIVPPPVPPVVPPAGGKPQGRPTTPNTTLAIQPQIIIAGMTAQVTGTGFTHNHKVTLDWVLPDGSKQPACQAPVTADKNGVFMFLCLSQRHEQVGERTLTATDSTHTASTPAIVMNGPMQPSGRRTSNSRLVVRN